MTCVWSCLSALNCERALNLGGMTQGMTCPTRLAEKDSLPTSYTPVIGDFPPISDSLHGISS